MNVADATIRNNIGMEDDNNSNNNNPACGYNMFFEK